MYKGPKSAKGVAHNTLHDMKKSTFLPSLRGLACSVKEKNAPEKGLCSAKTLKKFS